MESYSKARFSLLLLDPGEIYFEDFSAYVTIKPTHSRMQGRLKLCSKSIVFEPHDFHEPLFKIPLSKNKFESETKFLVAHASFYIAMLSNNIPAPYEFIQKNEIFYFELPFASTEDTLGMIQQLQRACTLPVHEHSNMISAIVRSKQSRTPFEKIWFNDLFEKVIYETFGNKVLPLVVNPGRILLTCTTLYYQPFNNIESQPVIKFPLKKLTRIIKRRFLLQQIGLEIFSEDRCLYLMLRSEKERDMLHEKILAQSDYQVAPDDTNTITLRWQHRAVSNYDYLLYLNSLSDRSFNDLTQYPVFPWVLSNYTSSNLDLTNRDNFRDLTKPVGALNPNRLESLKIRREAMPHPNFLYGSHYSAPGFVLFYLARKYPNYVLCLQNGRFDHPDRMFNSISDVWRNVLSNMSDFKELTAEFYDPQNDGDFLVNLQGIDFGLRSDGSKVDDVLLPAWAENAKDFIHKMRDALESDIVSENIHQWIDLIFGYKQRDNNAEEADNVFHWLCYEGAVDLNKISDPIERHALEVQIMEFGQVPKQLFSVPHPPRFSIQSPNTESILKTEPVWYNLEELEAVQCGQHKQKVTCMAIGSEIFCSGSQDGVLKVYSSRLHEMTRSIQLGAFPITACIILPQSKFILISNSNNEIICYDVDYSKIIDSIMAHTNTITSFCYKANESVLFSSSRDCTIRIWSKIVEENQWKKLKINADLIAAKSPIDCATLSNDGRLLGYGCSDGLLQAINLSTREFLLDKNHLGPVTSLSFSQDSKTLASCSIQGNLLIHDMTTGMRVCEINLDYSLTCLVYESERLLLTSSDGCYIIWDFLEGRSDIVLKSNREITALAVCDNFVISGEGNYAILRK